MNEQPTDPPIPRPTPQRSAPSEPSRPDPASRPDPITRPASASRPTPNSPAEIDSRPATDSRLPAPLRLAEPFRFMADHASDAFFLVDADGLIAYANRVAHAERGYDDGDLIGLPFSAVAPPSPGDHVDVLADQGAAFRIQSVHRRRDGSTFPVESSVNYLELEGRTYVFSSVRDVSERRRADAELREHQARTALVVRQADVGVWSCDLPFDRLDWDAKTKEHFFLPADAEVTIGTFFDRLHPDDRAATQAAIERAIAAGELYDTVYRTLDPADPTIVRYINAIGRAHYAPDGTPTRLDGITADVTQRTRAAAALRESEARFRLMANGAPVMVWVTEPDGYCSFLNDRWYEFTGQSVPESLGIGWTHATHPDDVERAAKSFLDANTARGPFYIEYRLRRRDGTYRWCIDSAMPRFGSDGAFLGYIGSVIDIHDRRLAEERLRDSEQRLQLAVAIAELGSFDIDLAGDTFAVNDAGRTIYGWGPEVRPTFATIRAARHPDDRARAEEAIATAIAPHGTGRYELEQRIRRPDGTQRWIRVRGVAIFADGPDRRATRIVGTFLDVTAQHEVSERREQLLLDAERARTDAERARAEAERASRLKDEFLTTLSHELRTPLNAILGWAHLLQRGDKTGDATVRQGLDTIQRNARAQAQLIADLLDVRGLVGGTLRLKDARPVDMAVTLREAAETARPGAEAKRIAITLVGTDQPAPVNGDPDRLRQILWNLLSNAVKFTPPEGRVRATVGRTDDAHVEVRIEDNGQGVDAEFLPHLFDRFTQADATITRRHGGLGIGLAIVKALVELHGGTVRAESAGTGQGAAFTVRLPTA